MTEAFLTVRHEDRMTRSRRHLAKLVTAWDRGVGTPSEEELRLLSLEWDRFTAISSDERASPSGEAQNDAKDQEC